MKSIMRRRALALVLTLIMVLGLAAPGFAADGDEVTVTILQTSDLHGMVNPFDYAANKENKTSMAHVAAIVAQERAADPDLLLIDTGDSLQANYIQEFRNEEIHPMIEAMNTLDYDAWVLGNHEFNFEFSSLEKASPPLRARPWPATSIRPTASAGRTPTQSSRLKASKWLSSASTLPISPSGKPLTPPVTTR